MVSLETPTASPVPPTATATLTPTVTPTPTDTPSPTATLPPVVHFMAVGDVMLARTIGDRILAEGPAAPFAGVLPILNEADLLVANLECAISERGELQPKAYTFRAPPIAAESLALAGIDVVSLANNHALDYGFDALADTLQLLGERQIAGVGAGPNDAAAHAPVIVERNGLRVAFLAYVDVPVESRSGFDTRVWIAGPNSPGVAWAEPDRIAADVAAAKAQADVVIVLLHTGLESRTEVTAGQRTLAHAAVDAGAALVLGAHPHVLQGVESYNGGLIAYSLGNFVFDDFTFPENYSAIFTATLTPDGVAAYDWVPVVVEDGLPRLATPEEAPQILERVQPLENSQ
ncbi:MAG: CapA family protein [Anaerolineales bacterium]